MNTMKCIVVLALCIASVMATPVDEHFRDRRFAMSPYYGMMGATSMMYPSMMASPIMTRSIMMPAMTAMHMPAMTMPVGMSPLMAAPLIR